MSFYNDINKQLEQKLRIQKNFDIINRKIQVGNKEGTIYFIDGFVKDDVMEKLQEFFLSLKPETFPKTAQDFMEQALPYVEAEASSNMSDILKNILSGVVALTVDGLEQCLLVDCRTYPARGVEEPQKDKVLRGSRDGFVETLVSNTALIRRRIRKETLSMEMYTVGEVSQTDVVLCYMQDRVEPHLLELIQQRLKDIKVEALTMNQETLAECLHHKHWWNPFPKFKFTERPDTACACLLEGLIIVLVDNSPSAMVVPTNLFDVIEEADDYYFPPITGTYLRFSRCIMTLTGLFLTPVFLLLMQNENWIPPWLAFIALEEQANIPIIWQLMILEIAIDGLKLAAINTPSMLSTPLSVIAALVIGEFAVNSGWFNAEVMLYMAFVAISNFTQESYELGYAVKFMRVQLLVWIALFNVWGAVLGLGIIVLELVCNKTIDGKSYLYPLIPFNGKQLKKRLIRNSYTKFLK